jgi:hypothetical protein
MPRKLLATLAATLTLLAAAPAGAAVGPFFQHGSSRSGSLLIA